MASNSDGMFAGLGKGLAEVGRMSFKEQAAEKRAKYLAKFQVEVGKKVADYEQGLKADSYDEPEYDDKGNLLQRNKKTGQVGLLKGAPDPSSVTSKLDPRVKSVVEGIDNEITAINKRMADMSPASEEYSRLSLNIDDLRKQRYGALFGSMADVPGEAGKNLMDDLVPEAAAPPKGTGGEEDTGLLGGVGDYASKKIGDAADAVLGRGDHAPKEEYEDPQKILERAAQQQQKPRSYQQSGRRRRKLEDQSPTTPWEIAQNQYKFDVPAKKGEDLAKWLAENEQYLTRPQINTIRERLGLVKAKSGRNQ